MTSYALLLALAQPFAATLAGAPVVFESGNWKVLRTADLMSDEVVCTAIHGDDYSKQLSENGLYLTPVGGVKMYQLRFDDLPAEKRASTLMDRMLSRHSVVLKNTSKRHRKLDQALAASRLRVEVFTILQTVEQFDLDLTGIREAYANIQAGCPGDPIGEAPK